MPPALGEGQRRQEAEQGRPEQGGQTRRPSWSEPSKKRAMVEACED